MPDFPKILILAAMDEEERALHEALRGLAHSDLTFSRSLRLPARLYTRADREILVARSGIGPVNAALSLATVHEHHPVDAVILLGVGGAITTDLEIGELVISERVLQHDSYSSLDFGNPRMRAGEYLLSAEAAAGHVAALDADPGLVDWIRAGLPAGHGRLATIVSGSEFVGTVRRKLELQALHPQAMLVDMEAAGVAQVATRLKLPFAVAKTVSDRLHADGTIESDFRACLESSARNAAELISRVVTLTQA